MREKIRMGMVGGGIGAFIGGVHRMAAALDGEIDLVCGAFSSTPERSKQSGAELGIRPERCYGTFQEMLRKEAKMPPQKRIQLVSIVTPNHMHYSPAKLALELGFHVICDKPLAFNLKEARTLAALVEKTGLIFALTHNYTGYPMVKQARMMLKNGELGTIRKVVAAYPQGWLSTPLEQSGQKQAAWRTDPKRSGVAGAMGDIGSHAENLTEYITGLRITELCADISKLVPNRQLDDDGNVLLRFDNGARGILYASQISAGEENNLNIKVYGEKGGLEWSQMEPNTLIVRWLDKPTQYMRTGVGEQYPETKAHFRIPAGHPEGYLEAFANIYRNVALCIRARNTGQTIDPVYTDFPSVHDGVRGMEFIDTVIKSGKSKQKWVRL